VCYVPDSNHCAHVRVADLNWCIGAWQAAVSAGGSYNKLGVDADASSQSLMKFTHKSCWQRRPR
jgi:hypothetical protein